MRLQLLQTSFKQSGVGWEMVGCTEVLLGVDHQAALYNIYLLTGKVSGSGW